MTSDAVTNAVPFLLLGDTRRVSLFDSLRLATERWRRDWAGEAAVRLRVEACEDASSLLMGRDALCFLLGSEPRPALGLVLPLRCIPWAAGARADSSGGAELLEEPHSLVAQLLSDALQALARSIAQGTAYEHEGVAPSTLRADEVLRHLLVSRYVAARMVVPETRVTMGLLVAPELAITIAPPRSEVRDTQRLERRKAAITEQKISIDAVLGTAEIAVADLATLSIGDVLVLNESLSEHGQLIVRGGERIAAFAPGRMDSRRAVQIKVESRKG